MLWNTEATDSIASQTTDSKFTYSRHEPYGVVVGHIFA